MKRLSDIKLWMGSEVYFCDRVLVLTIAHVIAVQSINFLVDNPVKWKRRVGVGNVDLDKINLKDS